MGEVERFIDPNMLASLQQEFPGLSEQELISLNAFRKKYSSPGKVIEDLINYHGFSPDQALDLHNLRSRLSEQDPTQ